MFLKDIRRILSVRLYEMLSTMDIPVYNVLPTDVDNPFIYVGVIVTTDYANKCEFIIEGTVDIEMHTGANGWNGSMEQLYEYLFEMKALLQYEKGSVITLGTSHEMNLWKIVADTGITVYDPINRLMSSTVTYEFKIVQKIGYEDRVKEDGGVVEAISCIPIQLR
ncbi:MAG: hypothetical protein DRQ78_04720 [Epsilonproteobacteria bacterium]|nr:MAG: hypothetical protein DRQ78_04720 [Campylobacterota bacterium]